MIWTLRRILVVIVLISSLTMVGTLVWVTETFERFALESQNDVTAATVRYLVRQRVSGDYARAVVPFADEWSRIATLLNGMRENAPDKARFAANQMMQALEVTNQQIRLRAVVVYDREMRAVARADRGSGESVEAVPALLERLRGRDLRARRMIETVLWRGGDGRPLHSTIAPVGGFQVLGFIEFVTDPLHELDGLGQIFAGVFRLDDGEGGERYVDPGSLGVLDDRDPDSLETLSVRIEDALGGTWAVAHLTRDMSAFTGQVGDLRNQALSILAAVVLASVLASWLLLRLAVFRRLKDFAAAMMALARGADEVALPQVGPDEFRTMRAAMETLRTAVIERERAEAEARRARDEAERQAGLLRATLENVGHGICVLDSQHRPLVWNDATAKLTGIPLEMFERGETFEEMIEYQRRNYRPEVFEAVRANNRPGGERPAEDGISIVETRYDRPGHEPGTWVQVASRLLPDGMSVRTYQDISERRQAEERIRTSEQRLQTLLDNMPVGVAFFDTERNLAFWNTNYCDFVGLSDGDIRGNRTYNAFATLCERQFAYLNRDATKPFRELHDAVLFPDSRRVNEIGYQGAVRHIRGISQPIEGLGWIRILVDITDRKRAEERIRDSERRLRAIIDNTPNSIYLKDLDYRYTLVNRAIASRQGFTTEAMIGLSAGDHFSADIAQRIEAHERTVIETGEASEREIALTVPGQESYIALMTKFPVIGDDGEITGVGTITYNITDRKRVETELREARAEAEEQTALLRLTLETMGDGILVLDRDKRVRLWNELAAYHTGLSRDVLARGERFEAIATYRNASIPLDPEAVRTIETFNARVAARESDVAASYQRRGPTPESWIQVNLRGLPNGGTVATYHDISELKHAEHEARESADLLRLTMEHIDQGFSVRDVGDKVLLFNNRLSELLGVPRDFYERRTERHEFLAHYRQAGTHDDMAPELREKIEDWIARANRGEAVERLAYERRGPDDTWLLCVLNQTPDRKQVRSFTDITRLKRAEEEARDAMAAALTAQKLAETANQAKSDFLSSMSHELRTPLNAIIGFSEFIYEDRERPVTPEQRDCVAQVLKAGRHLLTLIDEVLDLSKIETGAIALSIEPVDVGQVVDECVSLTASMAAQRGIAIHNRLAGGLLPPIRVDRVRFKQALLNFISNAVKYNHANGEVFIERLDSETGRVRLAIRDTGPGIPASRIDSIFDPFDRLGAENSDVEGTGIGLTITKRLVEQMGGEIGLSSTVGEGTTFWVDFATTRERPVVYSGGTGTDETEGRSLSGTILHIEDNPTNLELVRRILGRQSGVHLIEAPSAEFGLVRARNEEPDLILLDINLPGMDGYDALAQLEAMPETRQVPVIALTAAATENDMARGRTAGFYAYLTKPLSARTLIETIHRALSPVAASEADAATAPLREGKVMVIDDMVVNLAVAGRQLSRLGLASELVEDPKDGLERLLAGDYAAALVDINMPGMTGLELTERLRAAERDTGRHTPVIALTASYGSEEEIRRYREAGMDGQLSKPVTVEALAGVLRRWIALEGDGSGQPAPEPQGAAMRASAGVQEDAAGEDSARDDGTPVDLAALAGILGSDDHGEFARLLDLFIRTFPDDLSRLEAAIAGRDPEATRRAAHAARSSAANTAARALAARLAAIEEGARGGDWPALEADLAAVRPAFAAVSDFVARFATARAR